jgi:hypothetical protein
MPEDEPIDRHAPTQTDDLKPSTLPPPESTTEPSAVLPEATKGDSYFAAASRDFAASLIEMRQTRRSVDDGFRNLGSELRGQSGELATIRHELQGFGVRISTIEGGHRDMRADLAEVKTTLRQALARIESLEAELPPKAKTLVPTPPPASP